MHQYLTPPPYIRARALSRCPPAFDCNSMQGESAPAADNLTLMIADGAAALGADEWSDEGQMYRVIEPDVIPGAKAGDPAAALKAYFCDGTHAFLNADSF